ncbi:hypothetical protein BP6252_11505 [Coleophoma cylindrospora]|uniref:Uncharacterized protein n=1 Tax=Coleophoma cylindrospora TaxID=1849047 RepID=A0A3D8QJT6_9HELO|nr:hypothetical protein BP6252_11505 [Coleophoma cylindrospora]
MEKLPSYTIPASRWRSKYAELTQSADNEHDVCPTCSHVQNRAHSSSTRSWLALWTIATVLFGVLVVSILLLARQYTFNCSCVGESSCPSSTSLLSDQAFPHIPLRRVVWKVEQEFVDADPIDGQHWGNAGDEPDPTAWTAWDDIYDGSWVLVEPDETLDIPPGVPIQNFSVEGGGSWRTPKHGYSPSINHQIHCLGWIKHYLMPSRTQDIDYEHAGHCVEYIRHAIMCQGDLTLEKPENPTRWHVESIAYDETVHVCRDWTALSSALRATSLGFEYADDRSLIPFDNSDWQPWRPVVPFEAI